MLDEICRVIGASDPSLHWRRFQQKIEVPDTNTQAIISPESWDRVYDTVAAVELFFIRLSLPIGFPSISRCEAHAVQRPSLYPRALLVCSRPV